jgi:diacylglycerol kinase family enzyme
VTSVLIVNPKASRVTAALTRGVAEELRRAGPLDVLETAARGHARQLAAEASATADRIYVYSGDGGFNEALNGVVTTVPVGVVPGGATNVLPRALGLPRDPVACARLLATAARPRRISLGRVNGRRFAFSASIGLDAAAVRLVDERGRTHEGRRPGDAAFVSAFARLLRDAGGHIAPQAEVVDVGRAAWILIANTDPYTYLGALPLHVAPEATFETGIDLVAPTTVRLSSLPRFLGYAFGGRGHERAPDLLYRHDVDRLEVRCDRQLPLQADGEDLGDVADALFVAERDAVVVLAPAAGEAGRPH